MKLVALFSTPIAAVIVLLFGLVVVVAPGGPSPAFGSAHNVCGASHVAHPAEPDSRMTEGLTGSTSAEAADRTDARAADDDAGCRAGSWTSPLGDAAYVLTAGFGECASHWQSCHTGQDFAVPVETRVFAVGDGVITFAGWGGPYGNVIHLLHPGGIATWYAHLSQLRAHVGERVESGTLIGLSGDTGNTTGPHLHLEVRLHASTTGSGRPVDPLPWLRRHHAL